MRRGGRKRDKIRLNSPVMPEDFFIMSVSGKLSEGERRKNEKDTRSDYIERKQAWVPLFRLTSIPDSRQ